MKKLIIDSSLTVTYKVVSAALKFGLVLIMTNLFGANEYGAFTFSMSIFLFVNTLFRFGFDIHLHKRIAEKFNFNNKFSCQRFYIRIATISMLTLFLFSILVKLLLPYIVSDEFINSSKYLYLSSIIKYGFIYAGFWLLVYYYRGLNKAKFSVIILELVFPILNILLIYLLKFYSDSPSFILVNSFGISTSICFLILFYSDKMKFNLFSSINFKTFPEFSKHEINKSMPFLFISVSGMLMSWVDFYIISFFESDTEIGVYSVATRIALLLLFPASAISIFFSNHIVALLKQNKKTQIMFYLKKITLGLFVLSLIIFTVFNVFNTQILSLFGKEFIVATQVLFVLSFAHMINASTGMFETVILMSASKKYLFKLNLITVLINLILNIPLVYYYGIEGAAVGTLIAIIANRIFQYWIIKKIIL